MSLPSIDPRPTLAAPDDDPYLWLEDVEGLEACAWAQARSEHALAKLADARCDADRAALREIFDCPDRIPHVARRGGLLYNFWRDGDHPRGLWRRTTTESYRLQSPEWDVLLDLDALAATDGEDWVWRGAQTRPPAHDRAILSLSRGGADAVVLREFDLTTRDFVVDGFCAPEAKSSVSWLDDDIVLLSSAYGEGRATTAGYARTVRLWRRGTDLAKAETLFEVAPERMACRGWFDRENATLVFAEQIDFFNSDIWLGDRTGPKTKIDRPTDAATSWSRGFVVVRPRRPWTVGEATYPADTILGACWEDFRAGARDFRVLFTPAPRKALQGCFWSGGELVISILDALRPVFLRVTPADHWKVDAISELPSIGAVDIWPLDLDPEEANGELLAMTQTPITPPTLSLLTPGVAAPTVLRQASRAFDPRDANVTRHEAIAPDGERIPYVQVGPPGDTGDAPVHMTGYGGFRVSSLPYYASTTGKLWLERGGTTVVANIRGGGEFGTWWHEAGRREGKARSHDDFAAVADDLVRRGVTRPQRIAAEGGSNGGLLIANMLTRHPEKFGALFCTIPLVDMRRYHKLLAGSSWMAEYGDPDRAEDWAFLQQISAYHVAEAGRPYPPILIATSRRDDRVHPGHARKFAAKLQALGYPALFYEPAAGGHGYGKDNAEVARFAALGMAFLRRAIGWEPTSS
ncbi:prolyl oligopeptidase family protein [Methylosinus sp. Sm6]|uniref:prolyl oligopeptidase family serine peptidase n=1 Tax=Methylosinus sp. Sm6 TaxID=2866948 RepID=UPI001C991D9F|nr:prolyl oligopeptidase family serine peptidase [Methylosinus sp. Sm6]MBY6240633.1 prolyl oligopeptidase family serine peptidase [Methylosinus sp. Sm6]